MEGEHKAVFEARFAANPATKRAYDGIIQRHAAAEQAWEVAKSHSLVSIKTATVECLLFGRLDEGYATP